MATITINDRQFEIDAGRPLVEVVKESGFYISNLCYIDGLPPYAGCRTCAVEVEGVRGLPLACTTTVQDGMVVRTDTAAVLQMRQEVMAFILANHSDRCLTCHRVEHCRTGEICLRDNEVTHRCVTCSKNYRCELQTASDLADVGRANVEPYLDEDRTYYQWQQPQPDRANPFLEFDPQMCILCTRCERACDDLRHTTAITLAGRGFSTRIAFGSGGAIDDSNCDFCGACIDVCPTATLMETPNKWVARPDRWVQTVCTECSLGCSIQLGVKNGRGVIVRPGTGNDVSRDQICVRGRYGYDQIRDKHRLKLGRLGRGEDALDTEPAAVLQDAMPKLSAVIQQHGPQAVGLLGSGQATNEDNYLVRRLAEVIGTPNLDAGVGWVWGAVTETLVAAFGDEHLPSRLTDVETADTLVVIADDLSASNNVLGVRVKDAVVKRGARLVSVSARRNPIDDFATVEMRPHGGDTAATVQAIVTELLKDQGLRDRLADVDGLDAMPPLDAPGAADAAATLIAGKDGRLAIVVAPSRHSAPAAAAQTRAAANLAIALCGPDAAPSCLHVLPPENNAVGLRDMGVFPGEGGLGVMDMLAAARDGRLKAMIIAKDNPVLNLPNRRDVNAALQALDLLLVIDHVPTDTVQAATHVLPDVALQAKDGTITNADRQMLRLRPAFRPQGSARPAWQHLQELAQALAAALGADAPPAYDSAAAVMEEIGAANPNYAEARYARLLRGARQPSNGSSPAGRSFQPVQPLPTAGDGLTLLTGRDLYTDRESAAIHLPDADRLHRGEFLEIHPRDAAARNIADGATVSARANGAAVSITAKVSEDISEGAVFVPILWNGGAVQELLGSDSAVPTVDVRVE